MMFKSDTMSFLGELDRASDSRKANLCRTWKNAQENDCGVLTINRHDFEARDGKKFAPRVRICCALVYPKVYYNFDVDTPSSGQGSTVDCKFSPNFDVHEHPANVMLMVEQNLRRITDKYHIKETLVKSVLEQMRESIEAVA